MADLHPHFERDLGDGLRLRSVRSAADRERVEGFNAAMHGEGVDLMARGLMTTHPDARPEHWLVVEDIATSEIVASLVLLPWTLRYESVALRSAEMGIVGTAEPYRRRGLQRRLNERFGQLMHDGGYVMSHIQGIGVFYRQFGYDYAMPLEADWRIEPYMIPNVDAAPYTFRPATDADIGQLARWYDEAAATLDISAVRDEQVWRYLLGFSTQTAMEGETIVVESSGTPVGYLRLYRHGFGSGLIVGEVSRLPADAIPATLAWLKGIAAERDKPYIKLNLPTTSGLMEVAQAFGAHHVSTYAWQVRIPDVAAFLRVTAPVLEGRVARSAFAGTTRTFTLDLVKHSVRLAWQEGRLIDVVSGPPADGDLRLLPHLAGPLMLGYRTLDELTHMFPDVGTHGMAAAFARTLWTPMSSFLYTRY